MMVGCTILQQDFIRLQQWKPAADGNIQKFVFIPVFLAHLSMAQNTIGVFYQNVSCRITENNIFLLKGCSLINCDGKCWAKYY